MLIWLSVILNDLPGYSFTLDEVYSVMMCNAIYVIHASNIFILIICILTQPG